jgi:hypothetical protein
VQFDDAAIDAGSQPEIVGIHDESFHSVECINPWAALKLV